MAHQPDVAVTGFGQEGAHGLRREARGSAAAGRDERVPDEVEQPRADGDAERNPGQREQPAVQRIEAAARRRAGRTTGREPDEDEKSEDAGQQARAADMKEAREDGDEVDGSTPARSQ